MKVLGLGLAAMLFAVGCGGGNSPSSGGDIPGINIQVTSPAGAAAVEVGQVVPITITVTNDSGNAGVIWSVAVQHKGDKPGTLTDIKPDSVTYNPDPGNVALTHVTVVATSVTDPGRAASIPISVYPAVAFPPQPVLANAFVNTDYTCIQQPITSAVIQIPCLVTASGGLTPYTWTAEAPAGMPGLPEGMFLGRGIAENNVAIVGKTTVSGIYPFTLRVTDSLGGTSTAALNLNVAPSQLKVVTPTILSTYTGKAYAPVQLQVSGGVPPYVWSLAPGSPDLPPGMSLTPNGVIAGTPTTGVGSGIAVRVRDSQSPVAAEATFPTPLPENGKIINLAVTSPEEPCDRGGSSVKADTPYAFVFSGFDADGPVSISGSFVADTHGDISSGIEDIVRSSGAQLSQALTAGSFIGFVNSGRGCMALNTAAGSTQFRTTPTAQDPTGFLSSGRLIEFDDNDGSGTRGSGSFRIQDSTAFPNALAGSYVVRFSGWNKNGKHFAMAGQVVADAGTFTSVIADINDGGTVAGPLSGNGTFTAVDVNGRGTATIAVGTQVLDLTYYLADASHAVFSSQSAASAGHPLVTGEATSSAGPFSASSLNNSQIYRLGGSAAGTADLNIGVLHLDGVAGLGGLAFTRAGGSTKSTSLAGGYSVDPGSGRVTFSGTAIPAVGYLASVPGGVTAYLVGTGSSGATGVLEFQTDSYPPGYQFNPVVGKYGFVVDEMLDPLTLVSVGNVSKDNVGNSYFDSSSPTLGLLPQNAFELFAMTFNPDGTGTFGGNTYMVTNGHEVFYIDLSPFNSHPAVIVGQLQTPAGIANFTPSCGPVGTSVVITGDNILQTTGVAFSGVDATSFTVNTNRQVTATVPEGATTGPITVTTTIGTKTSDNIFTVQGSVCH